MGKNPTGTDVWESVHEEVWGWYAREIAALGPIQIAIVNGDMIDGAGERSGGTEQLTTDRQIQAAIAIRCVEEIGAQRHVFTYGTGYHTGNAEDFEQAVAHHFGAKIGSHEWLEVNGVTFDVKHHLGSSSIPHGRFTSHAKEKLWNDLWNQNEEQPRGDIYIRSHVHYHSHCGGIRGPRQWLAMSLPAMQMAHTKYGGRRCNGTVDFGFVHFDIFQDGTWSWQPHIARLASQKPEVLRFSGLVCPTPATSSDRSESLPTPEPSQKTRRGKRSAGGRATSKEASRARSGSSTRSSKKARSKKTRTATR